MANSNPKPPNAGKGRPKGAVNKTTKLLKDAILQAAREAGDGDLVAYLKAQALENPGPFMTLLGKVLPMTVAGDKDNPLEVNHRVEAADKLKTMIDAIASRANSGST